MTKENSNNQLVVTEKKEGIDSIINFNGNATSIYEAMDTIAKAYPTTFTNKNDAFAKFVKSKELGIGFLTGAEHMHSIQGKTGVDIHIIRAMLLSSKSISWELVKNYQQVPIYKAIDGSEYDYIPNGYELIPKGITKEEGIKLNNEITNRGNIAIKLTGYDFVTEYKFSRIKQLVNNDYVTITAIGKFSWNEALHAKLPLDKNGDFNQNSAWYKYRKLMVDTRAFTFGARAIADDLLMGMREYTELLDINNINYNVDIEGNVKDISDLQQ